MTMSQAGVIERAFEVANSGSCQSFENVRKTLKKSGYTDSAIEQYLGGPAIRKQIRDACRRSRTDAPS